MKGEIWTRKYAPTNSSEIVGQKAVEKVKKHIQKGTDSIFINGPVGSGKTSSVYAIAEELGNEVVEINGSDKRTKKGIRESLEGAVNQGSLFGKSKIILIDELEALSGRYDRGGKTKIKDLIDKSSFPIVLIALDAYDRSLKKLRKKSKVIDYNEVGYKDIVTLFKRICKEENISYEEQALKHLARTSGGDVRAAINDLQMASQNVDKIKMDDVKEIQSREQEVEIKEALRVIFKTKNPEISRDALDNVDMNVDELFLWLQNNIPREYTKPKDLAKAMDVLGLADVFHGRIARWQYYRFYVYIYDLMTIGVSLSKEEKYDKNVSYKEGRRKLNIWIMNRKVKKKESISQKIADETHSSKYEIMKSYLPHMKPYLKNNLDDVSEELELEKKEKKWIKNKL